MNIYNDKIKLEYYYPEIFIFLKVNYFNILNITGSEDKVSIFLYQNDLLVGEKSFGGIKLKDFLFLGHLINDFIKNWPEYNINNSFLWPYSLQYTFLSGDKEITLSGYNGDLGV